MQAHDCPSTPPDCRRVTHPTPCLCALTGRLRHHPFVTPDCRHAPAPPPHLTAGPELPLHPAYAPSRIASAILNAPPAHNTPSPHLTAGARLPLLPAHTPSRSAPGEVNAPLVHSPPSPPPDCRHVSTPPPHGCHAYAPSRCASEKFNALLLHSPPLPHLIAGMPQRLHPT